MNKNHSSLRAYEAARSYGGRPSIPVILSALKASASLKNLELVRTIHNHVKETGDSSNKFVASTLVDVYARCGSMHESREAFEAMVDRDVVAWNCVISGYAKQGQGGTALQLFSRMSEEGCDPDHVTFLSALKACSSLVEKESKAPSVNVNSLERVRALHAEAARTGNEKHIFVGNSLIDLYTKGGSMPEARNVFDRIEEKSLVSWTSIIMGYARNGLSHLALELYREMREQGVQPDALTLVAALKACVSMAESATDRWKVLECLNTGREIHLHAVEAGAEQHMFVASSLLDVYSTCGVMSDAKEVFDKMTQRSVVSWTAMIMGYAKNMEGEMALEIYKRMQEEGVRADAVTYVAALKACNSLTDGERWSKPRCLEKVGELHAEAARSGELHMFVASALVCSYAKCRSMKDARDVFESMKKRTAVSWTGLIQGYVENDQPEVALKIFLRMQREGCCSLDGVTLVAALKACILMLGTEGKELKASALEAGKALHSEALRAGLDQHQPVASVLVEMYGKSGSSTCSRRHFDSLNSSISGWNSILTVYAETCESFPALELFREMLNGACEPNAVTYVVMLKLSAGSTALETGRFLCALVFHAGFHHELQVGNSMLDFLGKCGRLGDAEQMFEWLTAERRNVVTWNALLDAYSRQGESTKVIEVFERMKRGEGGVLPDDVSYVIVLAACSHGGLVDEGRNYFDEMEKVYGLDRSVRHYACMVDMLGRANRLEEALDMMERYERVDSVMWTALLDAARRWKNESVARLAFESVVKLGGGSSAPFVLMASTQTL